MSRSGKVKRKATHYHEQLALHTFRSLAKRFHDALYHYASESNWALAANGTPIWIGQGSGPAVAQEALKGQQ